MPLDLTRLVEHVRARGDERHLFTFEGDRVVTRTHRQVCDDVEAAVAKLEASGVKPGTRVGIRAPNSYEWVVYDLALIRLGATSVAFTDDFASTPAEELVSKYELALLLDSSFTAIQAIERDATNVHSWMIFSSGSSGGLKGLTIARKGVEDWVEAFTERVGPRPDDRLLIFLPLSNFQQRPMIYAALWYGIDFIVTNPPRLFIALKQLSPTILIAPPTLYEVFETRFSSLPAVKRFIALALARIAPRKVFKQAYDTLGGRMRFMITGMAPIKRSALELFQRMQLPLYETYGLVECGSIALNAAGASKVGSVGRPLKGLQVTLAGDGEIIVRRDNPTAVGYFECAPGENEKTFLGDNRVATGDHGRIDEDGYLYLIGRKKEVIITAGGEKVHPEAVEAEIDACSDVAKSVVFGDDGTSSLTAVIALKQSENGAKARVEKFVERRNSGRRFEVGRLVFTDVQFSRENGFLRPNLKLDRKRIREHFIE